MEAKSGRSAKTERRRLLWAPRANFLFLAAGAIIAAYLVFFRGGNDDAEAMRRSAESAFRAGAALSATVSTLAMQRGELERVRRLAESPDIPESEERYGETVKLFAETVSELRGKRNERLMNYFGKILEIRRHSDKRIAKAMNGIRRDARTPREKAVAELVNTQIDILRKNPHADPKRFLLEFEERFAEFAD